MTGLAEAVGTAWLLSLALDLILSIVYIATSNSRDSRGGLPGPSESQVRRQSVWGMVLAVPALLFSLSWVLYPGGWTPWALLLLGSVIPLYVIPARALLGRSTPPVARWYPAVFAIGLLPVLVLLSVFADGFGAMWLVFFKPISTRLGFGYAADCMVAVRFARAVERRDTARFCERELVRFADSPGFVWPT